jgi:hypothetical protein
LQQRRLDAPRQHPRGPGTKAAPGAAPAGGTIVDAATYKPQTKFDNTPWRFDMNQNGKRMTAEEFDAWMKARGVRVAKGNGNAAPAVTPATPTPSAAPVGSPPGTQAAPSRLAEEARRQALIAGTTPRHGLARALSKRGLCSRTQASEWIRAGRVSVDGRIVRDPEFPTIAGVTASPSTAMHWTHRRHASTSCSTSRVAW